MRRISAALLATGLGWSILGAPVSAHEASGQWTSPTPPAPDAAPVAVQPELAGTVSHDDRFRPVVEVTFAVRPLTERPAACPAPPELPAWPAEAGTASWRFLPGPPPEQPEPGVAHYEGFACNGTYELVAQPRVANDFQHGQPAPVTTTLALAVPPAPPADVQADLAKEDGNRVARIDWVPPADLPPDVAGYLVERSINGGDWEQLGIAADEAAWTDGAPHRNAGKFRYRVSTVRLGASGTNDDLVASAPAEERVLDVPQTSTATTGPAGPSTAGPPPGPRQLATSGGGEVTRQGAVVAPGPPTTVDNGYGQTLDYGGRRPVTAAGDGGSVLDVLGETPEERKELLTPVAGALVLLMWFVLLRYLLRQAAKQPLPQSSTA